MPTCSRPLAQFPPAASLRATGKNWPQGTPEQGGEELLRRLRSSHLFTSHSFCSTSNSVQQFLYSAVSTCGSSSFSFIFCILLQIGTDATRMTPAQHSFISLRQSYWLDSESNRTLESASRTLFDLTFPHIHFCQVLARTSLTI